MGVLYGPTGREVANLNDRTWKRVRQTPFELVNPTLRLPNHMTVLQMHPKGLYGFKIMGIRSDDAPVSISLYVDGRQFRDPLALGQKLMAAWQQFETYLNCACSATGACDVHSSGHGSGAEASSGTVPEDGPGVSSRTASSDDPRAPVPFPRRVH